jgi:hypothetical protein
MQKEIGVPTYLESVVNELSSKYRRLDRLLTHAPSKGTYHEKILRDMIRSYLPNSFSTGEGFIINDKSEISPQTDILIVDNLDPRSYAYKDDNFYIAADISVACFAEVKTYCKKSEFLKSFQNIVNTSLLLSEPQARSTSFIFCYDVYGSKETFKNWIDLAIENLNNKSSLNTYNYPNYIFCLKKKIMFEKKYETGGLRYWNITSNAKSTIIEQKILESVFQCVTDGCGRMRTIQGIKLLK